MSSALPSLLALSGKAITAGEDWPIPARTRGQRLAAHRVRVQIKWYWAPAAGKNMLKRELQPA